MQKAFLKILSIGSVLSALAAQGGISISFSGDANVVISPAGPGAGEIHFLTGPDVTPYQWYSSDGAYLGSMTSTGPNGGFLFNNIQPAPGGNGEVATITTSGTISILDQQLLPLVGHVLSATLDWHQLYGGYGYTATTGNATVSLDVQPGSYSGFDPGLTYLAAHGGYITVQLQGTSGLTLEQLAANGLSTSYGGALVSPVPETSTTLAGLGALGLLVLMVVRSRKSNSAQVQ